MPAGAGVRWGDGRRRGRGTKRYGSLHRSMNTAEIDGECLVDEHPDVVIAHERELVILRGAVLKPEANFSRETEVVRWLASIRGP